MAYDYIKRTYGREQKCPNCQKLLDAASGVDTDGGPKPDDFTICMYCGHLMAFDGELLLRELTDAEMLQLAGDPRVVAVQTARHKVMGNKQQ